MPVRLMAVVRAWLSRRRIQREVDDELRFHVEQEIEANLARGLSPAEARRVALAELGGLTHAAESIRDVRAGRLGRLHLDVRDALRGLRNGRGTTALAFAILTITMAAGTVTFSVVDAVAIRPLPFGSPDRLVGIALPSEDPGRVRRASPEQFFTWRDGALAFESLGAARHSGSLSLDVDGVVERLTKTHISANLFDVLRVRPAAGQWFGPEHERPGGPAGVILSHELWATRFAANPDLIGRQATFVEGSYEVIGVLPEGVSFPIGNDRGLYVPYVATPSERVNNRVHTVYVVGRLRNGVSVEQARADIERLSASTVVQSLHDEVVGPAGRWLLLVLAAVGVVLLVACANVANLLLGRATTRARELATREALGASRARLAGGLLLEGLILALLSATAAALLAYWGVEITRSNLPPGLSRVSSIAVDGRVLTVCMAVATMCAVVCASAPAWLASRSDLIGLMKTGGGPLLGARRQDRVLSILLVADVAFVCVLLLASTLVVTSFVMVTTADLGFDRRNVMSIWFVRSLDGLTPSDREVAERTLHGELLRQVRAVPGVASAALSDGPAPLSGSSTRYSIDLPGRGDTFPEMLEKRAVTAAYFDVMDMRLRRGRLFRATDDAGSLPVMLINKAAAARFSAGSDPVGTVVGFWGQRTIVGVLDDLYLDGPEAGVRPEMYVPLSQRPYRDLDVPDYGGVVTVGAVVLRTTGDPRLVANTVQHAVKNALGGETSAPTFVGDDFRRITTSRRFNAGVMATFGFIAVGLGAIGIYGAMAFVVSRQVWEIGLRLALGASPSDVRRSVLGRALRLVGVGAATGLAAGWAASEVFTAFVFGIRPTEPMVYVAVGGFLALVGFIAALIPALYAARLDPLTALRCE